MSSQTATGGGTPTGVHAPLLHTNEAVVVRVHLLEELSDAVRGHPLSASAAALQLGAQLLQRELAYSGKCWKLCVLDNRLYPPQGMRLKPDAL